MKLSLAVALLASASSVAGFTTYGGRAFTRMPLRGIMEEIASDAYDISAPSQSAGTEVNMDDAYEVFLAELVFSANDPRVDIANNMDRAMDDNWIAWLGQKIETSKDPEERFALRDLLVMVKDVKKRYEISKLSEERQAQEEEDAEKARLAEAEAAAEAGRSMSDVDVLRKATAINTAASLDAETLKESKKVTFYDEQLTPEIRLSYDDLLKKVLPPYTPGQNIRTIVISYYDQFDAQFVKVLSERASGGDDDAQALLTTLAEEQRNRLQVATETLKSVLVLGDAMRMEGLIVKLAREGKIDEAFLLLLEANATQARDAGALGPAALMERLRNRAMDEKDKQATSKEIRLIRQLLRTEDPTEREKILEDAFTPRESLIVPGTAENARKAVDGEIPEENKPMPDVPPPDFINACKAVLLNFGNLGTNDDRGDLASRIRSLAAEAEVVATKIYGVGMSPREQQDRVWNDQTTSVFDLEKMELEAERMGDSAPWANPDAPDDLIPGFDASGRMQVGGG